jgi:CzcA family heavy metal efflux pump
MVKFSLRNPYFIGVLVAVVVIMGTIAYSRLPKDLLPLFHVPAVQVLTLYPGMPTEVVEKDITTRLERWTGQSIGIDRQESRSMLGVSIVRDYFRPDVDINSALSQVTSLAMSDLYYLPPGTIPPMVMPFDPTATVPLALLTVSSDSLNEKQLYDIAYFDLRNRLQGIPGVVAPAVYGGKLRRILTRVSPDKLAAYNLSSLDIVRTLSNFNTLIPAGDMKIGDKDYQIVSNSIPHDVKDMDGFPIRSSIDGKEVLISQIGATEDTSQIQTNVVRVNGKRQVYIPIYRQPGANTIAVIDSIRGSIADILTRLPQGVKIDIVADQSTYVRQAIHSLVMEILQGGGLAVLIIWLFLGSFRTSLSAAVAIPLSVLITFACLALMGDTLNVMTLGGLALAIGPLIDYSIVVTENIVRHRRLGEDAFVACEKGASEVVLPVLAAAITTAIVFVPVFFLLGITSFLFSPLARTVMFAVGGAFLVALAVIPLFMRYFSAGTKRDDYWFQRAFERFSRGYRWSLARALTGRYLVYGLCVGLLALTVILFGKLGQEFFPSQDAGQLTMRVRLPSGTRIEKTEEAVIAIEKDLRDLIPAAELSTVIANIGVLYDWPAAYTPNAGPQDAFFEIQLDDNRQHSSQEYAALLRERLSAKYPDSEIIMDTGGMLTAALTLGLSSPINIQVIGDKLDQARAIAKQVVDKIGTIPGVVDVHIQQRIDYPQITVDIDRRKAASMGLNVVEVVKNLVSATNSSVNFQPAFWIDPKNGNHYFVGAQYKEADLVDQSTLENILITSPKQEKPVRLKEIATLGQATAPTEINHSQISRVTDIFANVAGRDIGSISREIEGRLREIQPPEGYKILLRGETTNLKESSTNLSFGFGLAVVLIYLVLVALFRSLAEPLIILITVPLGLAGVVGALWLTGTTLNIQSFLGTIFMAGVAVSNGILIVEFVNVKYREEHMSLRDSIVEGASLRLRPILMTSFAAMLALLPMAIGVGRGAEANVPLARAVIGGLLASTFLSLFVVPCLYYTFNRRRARPRGVAAVAVLSLAAFLIAPGVGRAGELRTLALTEALTYAKAHYPEIRAAAARLAAQDAVIQATQAAWLPQIDATFIDSQGMSNSYAGLRITGISNSAFRKGYGVSLNLEQNIYDFGRTRNRVDTEKARFAEIEAEQDVTLADVLKNVADRYVDCQRAGRYREIYARARHNLEPLRDEIQSFVNTGQRSEVDLALTDMRVDEVAAQEINAEHVESLTVERLNLALGNAEGIRYACDKDSTLATPSTASLGFAMRAAKENRPELRAMDAALDRAHFEMAAAQAEYLPKVVGIATVGHLQDTNVVDDIPYAVGIAVKVPLFYGFRTQAEVAEAAAEVDRLWLEAQLTDLQIASGVRQAIEEYRRTMQLANLAQKRRDTGDRTLKLAHDRYVSKGGILSEWDQAYRAWLQSEIDYWNVDAEQKNAVIGLYYASGSLKSPPP